MSPTTSNIAEQTTSSRRTQNSEIANKMHEFNNRQWPFLPTDKRPLFYHPRLDSNVAPTSTGPWMPADSQPRKRSREENDDEPTTGPLTQSTRSTRKVRVTPELRESQNAGRFRISDVGHYIVPWIAERAPVLGRQILSVSMECADKWWIAPRHKRLSRESTAPKKYYRHARNPEGIENDTKRDEHGPRKQETKMVAGAKRIGAQGKNQGPGPKPKGIAHGPTVKGSSALEHRSEDTEQPSVMRRVGDKAPLPRQDAVLLSQHLIPAVVPKTNPSMKKTRGRSASTIASPSVTSKRGPAKRGPAMKAMTSTVPSVPSPKSPTFAESPTRSARYEPTKTSRRWEKIILQSKARYPNPSFQSTAEAKTEPVSNNPAN